MSEPLAEIDHMLVYPEDPSTVACSCGWKTEVPLGHSKDEAHAKHVSDLHGPVPTTWFGRGTWPTCKCGLAPRDNGLLNAHWAEHGFRVVDEHGHLVKRPIQ